MDTQELSSCETMKNENRNKILITVLKGMIVGTGAILPGVSGGVLCMAFGIYEPLMDVLSDPIHRYKNHLSLLITFLIGWLLGFLLLAKLLEVLFLKYETASTVFFAGAIFGTIPGLLKQVKQDKLTYISLLGWTALFTVLFMILNGNHSFDIEANVFWYIFCGAIWGLSLIVPGLSSSSILIMMGLYQKMTAGIAAFDLKVIGPLLLGLLVTVLSLSKLVNKLFETHRSAMILFISGVMCASSICMLVKVSYVSSFIPLYILIFVLGFIIATRFDK